MGDGGPVGEMITNAVMHRFFLLGEYFLPFPAGNFGEKTLRLAKSLLHWLGRLSWVGLSSHQVVFYWQVFRDVAYKAKNGADLVAGVDEFLDQVTVLPPGEWDPSIRIEPPKNVPSQVGAASAGGARGTGRTAGRLGMLFRGPNSQGPTLTQSQSQTRSKTSQGLQIHSFILLPF